MNMQNLFFQLKKVDAIKGLVTGIAACEEPDKANEIFDYVSSKPHFEQWSSDISKATGGKSVGNVRAMHGKVAAGKLTDIRFDDVAKSIEVDAKIVDANELKKLEECLFFVLSIGGDYEKKWKDGELVRYTAKPNEISIVDNPCMPSATFSLVKEDGSTEMRKFHTPAPTEPEGKEPTIKKAAFGIDEGVTQGFRTDDGKFFMTKAEARAHRAELADPAAKLTAAVAALETKVAKAEDGFTAADASKEAESEVIEIKDITELPEVVRLAMADSDTAEVFRVAFNHARANGMSAVEALNDAWGKIVEGSEKTLEGKYKVTGKLLPNEKAAGLSAGETAALAGVLGRNAPAPAGVAKKDFTPAQREKAADEGKALADGSFPIATKGDLANAIKAFGRAKNKAAVKAHIIKRATALGAEASLPDSWKPSADKATVAGALRKGLYGVSRLAELIESLEYIQSSQEMEEAREGDGSTLSAELKKSIAALCANLRAMVEEETNEMLDDGEMLDFGEMLEMAAGVKGVSGLSKLLGDKPLGANTSKVLAEVRKAFNKAQAGHATAAHAGLAAAGAKCPNQPGGAAADAKDEETEKMAKAGARHGAADQAHLDSAHDHLDKMGYCAKDGASAEKMAKGMSGTDKVHLDSAHDHVSAMGIGKCAGMAEKMAKAGARHSAADTALLTDAHDHMAKAGASCPAAVETEEPAAKSKEASASTGDLMKSLADKNAVIDRLEKAAADNAAANASATAALAALTKRIEHVESQAVPDPRDRAWRVVSKADDDAKSASDTIKKAIASDPRSVALALISDAQAHPIDVSQVGR